MFCVYYNSYSVYVQCSVKRSVTNDVGRVLNGDFNFKYNYTIMTNMLKKKLSHLEELQESVYDYKKLCDIGFKMFLIKNELEYIYNGTVNEYENELVQDIHHKLSILDNL